MDQIRCADFLESLALLIEAGVPVLRAMTDLKHSGATRETRNWAKALQQQLSSGLPLSDSFEGFPGRLEARHIALIHAHAQMGTVHLALKECAQDLRILHEQRNQLLRGLLPPALLLHMAVILPSVSVLLLDSTQAFFREVGSQLAWVYGIAAVVWFLATQCRRIAPLRLVMDHSLIRLPVVGRTLCDLEHARFFRTLGSLYSAGITIPKAFLLATQTYDNSLLRKSAGKLQPDLARGGLLENALQRIPGMPSFVEPIVAVHREAGRLEVGLQIAASRMQDQGARSRQQLLTFATRTAYLLALAYAGYRVISLWMDYMSQLDEILDGL